ncbi:exported hypothetical protein [Xanthomonas citri pv. citri]|nr:exported hypothetical protein [Xanthomonas citri pv. citri]
MRQLRRSLPDRRQHKRLHKGGVLGSGLAGVGALAKIGAGWRLLAGWASVAMPGQCCRNEN